MKGLAYQWVFLLLGMVVITFLFMSFNEVYDNGIYNFTSERIRATDTTANSVFIIFDTVWNWLPVFFLFLVLIYAITVSQKRNLEGE